MGFIGPGKLVFFEFHELFSRIPFLSKTVLVAVLNILTGGPEKNTESWFNV
jgi:hypothetical protein